MKNGLWPLRHFVRRLCGAGCIAFALLAPMPGHAQAAGKAPVIPNPVHFKGVVLAPDGKPAADAIISFYLVDAKAQTVASEQTLRPSAAGAFDIAWTWDTKTTRYPIMYVFGPEGVAVASLDIKPMTVTLEPATSVRVHLLDEAGHPIAGVRLCPQMLDKGRQYGGWDSAITDRLSAVTDDTGMATITGLPQDWTLQLDIADPRYVKPDWNQHITLAKSPRTPDATVRVSHGGTLAGTITYGPTQQPAPNVSVSAAPVAEGGQRQSAETDAQGHYQIAGLAVGSYTVSIQGRREAAPFDWTAKQQAASVTAGVTTGGINFALIHGGVLTGTVTDPKTGKPIPSVGVYILGPGGDQYAWTDNTGRYTLHSPPGSQRVILSSQPGMTPDAQKFVDLADGEIKTVNFQSTPPVHPAAVRGTVVGPDGKAVPGAHVTAAAQGQQEQDAEQTADAQGRFVFDNPGLMPDMRLYARSDAQATLAGTLAAGGKPVVLHLAPGAKTIVRGRVLASGGKGIAGATVMLFRQFSAGGGGRGDATTTTNAAGTYTFSPDVPDATYSAEAHATGFGSEFTQEAKAVAGKPLMLSAVTLPRTDSFVGGKVVDVDGKPLAGADVYIETNQDKHVVTDTQGRFHLTNAPRDKVILEVRAANGRFASIEIGSGRDDNTITAESPDEQAAEGKRFVALRDADPTNHGDGAKASVLLHNALSQAGHSGKAVFLVFHASWCGPCFLLHRFLRDPLVRPVMDAHFVTQDIDIWEHKDHKVWENPGGTVLYSRYGGEKSPGHMQGVPFFALLDAKGQKHGDARMQGENIGFPSDAASQAFFLKTLQAAAPKLTAAELAILKAGLARNAKI